MTEPFLTTKLYIPPARPDLIRRERLLAYLDEGLALGRKLFLVAAPAGFGKTTLVSEWVHYRAATFPPCRCAWLTLDQGDNRLPRFIVHLVGAFQKIYTDLGQAMLQVVQLPQAPPVTVVLTELLNEIVGRSGGEPQAHYLLVLDDYQEITEPAVHEAVTFLLQQLPAHWHLVLTTRADPALPLARLRARGQLTEIRAADLRFTATEITTYLQQVTGLAYSQPDITALTARTEGWVAGLQLLGLLIQEALRRQSAESPAQIIRNFTGAHRYVIDYLTDEVLERQPTTMRDFLLRTAILERFTVDLCDHLLLSEQPSQALLTDLEKHNLFLIPLDEQRRWYRYHRLFADLLQTRLHQEVSATAVAALHLRASTWFEQQDLIAEALHHAQAAGDLDRAVALVAAHAMPMIRRGAITTAQEWLKALPPDRVRTHPRLCIDQAWALFHMHKPDEIAAWTQAAEAALLTPAFADAPDRAMLLEHILALRLSVAELRQENGAVVQLAEAALARLADAAPGPRGTYLYFLGRALCNLGETRRGIAACRASIPLFEQAGVTLAAMGARSDLAVFLRQQGQLRAAQRLLEDALRWADKADLLNLPATAQMQTVLGQIYYEQNELAAATDQLQRSIHLAKYMLPLTAGLAYLAYAQVQLALDNHADATVALQEAEQVVAQRVVVPPEATLLAMRRVRLWLMQGDFAAVEAWFLRAGLPVDDNIGYGNEQEMIAWAHTLTTRGRATHNAADLQQAARLLTRLENALRNSERKGHWLEVLLLQALTLAAQAQPQAAMTPLTAALHLAEPEGYLRIFVDEGAAMQQLLATWQQQAADQANPPPALIAYVRRLQRAFSTQPPSSRETTTDSRKTQPITSDAPSANDELDELLSPREIEVLHLMAAGLDNTKIAGELTVAVSTVKTHVNRIFAKLAVRSRTQAVARARERRLLA